jgi:hypothetical protein
MSSEWIANEAVQYGLKAILQKIDHLENIEFPSPMLIPNGTNMGEGVIRYPGI